jgi:osmotically-inducible protein OsmY
VYATNQSANASSQSQPSADSSQTIEVRGTTDADKQIGAQFVQQLKNEPSLASVTPSLRLSIENGKAILRGTVKSQDEKDKVEAIAKQVPGVNGVENQLTVGANGTSQINETR